MSREIKFRFFSKDRGMIYEHDGWVADIGINQALRCSADYGYKIMQFTGMQDKKGKDIYEGDIVKWKDNSRWGGNKKKGVSQIVWSGLGFNIEGSDFGYEGEDIISWDDLTVIGNIYQNKNLLKKKRDGLRKKAKRNV